MRRDDHSKIGELLTRREVTALPAYDPGADPEQIRTEYGVFRISKLSNNETHSEYRRPWPRRLQGG
jgi:hypothetical protein